jgi:hypothetical protein
MMMLLFGADSGIAFLSIIVSFQVVWTSFEVMISGLILIGKEETSCKILAVINT